MQKEQEPGLVPGTPEKICLDHLLLIRQAGKPGLGGDHNPACYGSCGDSGIEPSFSP
jgi:hypothetical protein